MLYIYLMCGIWHLPHLDTGTRGHQFNLTPHPNNILRGYLSADLWSWILEIIMMSIYSQFETMISFIHRLTVDI